MILERVFAVFAVFRFEFSRSLTFNRIAGWLMLVSFPVFITAVIKYHDIDADPVVGIPHLDDPMWGTILFGLIPEVISLLGLLLWATPLVHAELEGKTWIYLAVRPKGRVSVFFGKYLTAVAWTAMAGWASSAVCVLIARPDQPVRMWFVLAALVGLACAAYGALYCLIGVLIQQRAMVIAVAYTLLFEFLISLIPALFNKLTIHYRLRNLLFDWMAWRTRVLDGMDILFGKEPAWLHLVVLIGMIIVLLAIGAQVIQRKEYVTSREV